MGNFIKVNSDGWTFLRSETGELFIPFGSNYYDPLAGWPPHLWKTFNLDTTRKHFELMKDIGVNIVRFHLSYPSFYDQKHKVNAQGVENLVQMLQICKEFEIVALIAGLVYYEGLPKWDVEDYFVSDEVIDNLCFFWRELSSVLKNEEIVFGYDIYNEPSIPWYSQRIENKWHQYLKNKYQQISQFSKSLDISGMVRDFNEIPIPTFANNINPALVFEYRMFQERLAFKWVKDQVEAIKSIDGNHLVTVGVNPWTFPDLRFVDVGYGKCRGFNTHFIAPLLDFVSVHYYPLSFFLGEDYPDPISTESGLQIALSLCEGLCRLSFENKPIVLEEFGWYGGGAPGWAGIIDSLPFKSEIEQAHYCRLLIESSKDWCGGWIQWTYGDTPQSSDISQFGGLVDKEGRLKTWGNEFTALAETIQNTKLARKSGTYQKQIDLFELYSSESKENQFWNEYLAEKEVNGSIDFQFSDQPSPL